MIHHWYLYHFIYELKLGHLHTCKVYIFNETHFQHLQSQTLYRKLSAKSVVVYGWATLVDAGRVKPGGISNVQGNSMFLAGKKLKVIILYAWRMSQNALIISILIRKLVSTLSSVFIFSDNGSIMRGCGATNKEKCETETIRGRKETVKFLISIIDLSKNFK